MVGSFFPLRILFLGPLQQGKFYASHKHGSVAELDDTKFFHIETLCDKRAWVLMKANLKFQ